MTTPATPKEALDDAKFVWASSEKEEMLRVLAPFLKTPGTVSDAEVEEISRWFYSTVTDDLPAKVEAGIKATALLHVETLLRKVSELEGKVKAGKELRDVVAAWRIGSKRPYEVDDALAAYDLSTGATDAQS